MKKILLPVALSFALAGFALNAQAIPSVDEVKADIENFQGYFKKKFPDLALEDYQNGVNAIPQYAERRTNWTMQLDFPPYEEYVEQGREEWAAPFANGKSFSDCFADKPAANEYPFADKAGVIHTVETDIVDCLKTNGEAKIKSKGQKIARLTIAFKEQANGQPMNIDFSSEAMRASYEKGREFYWTKRGQLNFACSDCHVHSAGKKIRGDVLSPGLGHGTGFPVYRQKWGQTEKPLGTIHRRYAGCNQQVRAVALSALGEDYVALEVYESIMNTGVPLNVPGMRQ